MKQYYNDGRISMSIYKEGSKWWLSVGDTQDASYLELQDYKTKKAAIADAEEIKIVAPRILTKKDRAALGEKYYHGGSETFGNVEVSYGPLYSTPMGRGFGTIIVKH